MRYYEGIDYFVRHMPFGCNTIFAWAVSLGDGTFDLWLNDDCCPKKQMEGLRHELVHLEENHFYRDDMTQEQKESVAWGNQIIEEPSLLQNGILQFPLRSEIPHKVFTGT